MESGADTPEVSALARFDPQRTIAGVEFLGEDQAVVQVGFPGKEAYYFVTARLASDGWYS